MFFLFTLLTVGLFSASDVSASVPLADNQSSYQTAFLYFLPDYQPKAQDEAEVRGCAKIGYTVTRKNCAAPRILKDKCPVGNAYKTCYCAGSPDCTGRLGASSPYPSMIGAIGTSCLNCVGTQLSTWTCSPSACSTYMLSSCPSHGNCSQCCNGKYKLNSCASGYHVSGNSCVKDETCLGTATAVAGLGYTCSSCTNLQGQTLYTCLCTEVCSLSSCPANGNCSTDCKGKVCLDSCKSGYSKSGNSCVSNHVHSYTCPSGYSETNSWGSSALTTDKTCSCGATSGTCYKAPACSVANCKECESGDPDSCKICDDGYRIFNKKCVGRLDLDTGCGTGLKKLTCVNRTYCCPASVSCSDINSVSHSGGMIGVDNRGPSYSMPAKCLEYSVEQRPMCNGTSVVCNGASYCCSSDIRSPSCDAITLSNCRLN